MLQRLVDGGPLHVAPSETKIKYLAVSSTLEAVRALIEADVAGHSDWAIKEVGGDPRKIVSLFRAAYSDGKVVQITRDPGFVARAVYTDRKRRGIKISLKRTIREAREPWRIWAAQREIANMANVLTVSYEDLTENTEAVMTQVCHFVGIPMQAVHLRPTLDGRDSQVVTASTNQSGVFSASHKMWQGVGPIEYASILLARITQ